MKSNIDKNNVTYMYIRILKIFIFCISLFTGIYGHAIGQSESIVIVPDTFLRAYDPITVFFADEMGPVFGGPQDVPGDFLSITPEHPGEYKWLDNKTLQFLPTIPWPALKQYSVKVLSLRKTLSTLMIPPDRIYPEDGTDNLEPLEQILLSFESEFLTYDLSEMISLEVKPLPGIGNVDTYWLTGNDFSLKEIERTDTDQYYKYQINLSNTIGYGKHIIMHIRLSLNHNIPGALTEYTFETKQEFRITGIGSGYVKYPVSSNGSIYSMEQAINCGTGTSPLFIEFSEDLAPLSIQTVKNIVNFEPSVNDLRYDVMGSKLYLYFNVDRDEPYKLTVRYENILSSSGRPLADFGDSEIYFYYRQLKPYLQWENGQAIVERYGPQMFPMEGRGTDQVDLRIYKIDPLSLNYWPYPKEPLIIDEESRPPMPGEEPPYGTNIIKQIKLLGSPPVSKIIDLPINENSGQTTFGLNLLPYLTEISGPQQPGTYLLGYRLLDSSSNRIYVRLTVTDISLSVIEEEHAINFIVTSLNSGMPIEGADIILDAEYNDGLQTIITGTTNQQGMFRYEHTYDIGKDIVRITVSKNGDILVLDPLKPPPHFVNNHWFGMYSEWLGWLNQAPRMEKEAPRSRGKIFTERPVYRPEEAVHIFGYIRLRQQGMIIEDDRNRIRNVVITAPGQKQWTFPIELTDTGSFYIKFEEEDLPTGEYYVSLRDEQSGNELSAVSFNKEAYRIPRFEIKISGPDRVPMDAPYELVLTADYYAGGRVVGQEVSWEITQYEYQISPPDYPDFIFSTDSRFSSGRPFESTGTSRKQDVTDENGSAVIEINPAVEEDGRPRIYIVEATVRGADSQTVTTVKQVIAVPAFVIGIKLDRFLEDEPIIRPEIILIDHNEELLAGKELKVRVYQRQWHSYLKETDFTTGEAEYVSDVVDELVYEDYFTSGRDPLNLEIPVNTSGVYIVEVSAIDNLGRLQRLQSDLYVAGETPVSWKRTHANVFDTSLDKDKYVPGDTAILLLKSPFQDAQALVIVEGPQENTYHWVDIENGQGLFSIEINEDMTPLLPVHTLLMRGRLPGTSMRMESGEDRGRPIAMANTTWIVVEPEANRVKLELEHDDVNLPGSEMKVRLRLTDLDGKLLNGEVTLWLVDRAVLSLGREKPIDPLYAFIDSVEAYIRIRETRNEVVGNLPIEEIPGGDGWLYEDEADESIMDKTSVRRNFQTVPYFNPSIRVVNGYAEITIDLPDNLTDFAIRAIASSEFSRFGFVKSTISIRLPVIVQSSLPRFVRPGDYFYAGGIGRIVEGNGGDGKVEIQVEGLYLNETETSIVESIQLEQREAQQLFFPIKVPEDLANSDLEEVIIRMAVERTEDSARDGFEVKLPVRQDVELRSINQFIQMEPDVEFEFEYPSEEIRTNTLEQRFIITREPEIIKMLSGMRFLLNYEHLCTEQRISQVMPGFTLENTLSKIGLEDEYTVDSNIVKDLFLYLESTLTSNGLYSYWPGSKGYVSLTAYVVEFLILAREAGYQFDDELLSKPTIALKEALRSDYQYFISGYEFNERIEALTALAKAYYFDDAYAQDLLVAAINSDLYSQAKILYLFLEFGKSENTKVTELIEDLWRRTVFKLVGDDEVFAGLEYKNSYWGGLILSSEMKTLAEVTRALYRSDPNDTRIGMMIDEITRRGNEDGWGDTSTNVAALLALGEVIEYPEDYSDTNIFELSFGNSTKQLELSNTSIIKYTTREELPGTLELLSSRMPENELPYVWYTLDYVPAVLGDRIEQLNEGFVVERELLEINMDNRIVNRNPTVAGEIINFDMNTIVEEHITVTNPSARNFVAIRIPFAAGFEIMNPELATSPKEADPEGTHTLHPSYSFYEDDQVTFYYDSLPQGVYHFYFRLQASFEGSFTHPPARAELMYDATVKGRSDGTRIVIDN